MTKDRYSRMFNIMYAVLHFFNKYTVFFLYFLSIYIVVTAYIMILHCESRWCFVAAGYHLDSPLSEHIVTVTNLLTIRWQKYILSKLSPHTKSYAAIICCFFYPLFSHRLPISSFAFIHQFYSNILHVHTCKKHY